MPLATCKCGVVAVRVWEQRRDRGHRTLQLWDHICVGGEISICLVMMETEVEACSRGQEKCHAACFVEHKEHPILRFDSRSSLEAFIGEDIENEGDVQTDVDGDNVKLRAQEIDPRLTP